MKLPANDRPMFPETKAVIQRVEGRERGCDVTRGNCAGHSEHLNRLNYKGPTCMCGGEQRTTAMPKLEIAIQPVVNHAQWFHMGGELPFANKTTGTGAIA